MSGRPFVRPFEADPSSIETVAEEKPGDVVLAEAAGTHVPKPQGRFWGRLAGFGILAAITAVTIDTVDRLGERIAQDPITGWPLAILLGIVGVAAIGVFGHEWLSLRALQRRGTMRAEALRLVASELHGPAPVLLARVDAGLPVDAEIRDARAAFARHGSDALADGERLVLFERTVLAPIDARAYRLVLASARDIGLLTALSPYGLLDGLLVLWRTTLMVRAVARLYGMAPSSVATAALLRRCLRNAALAGIADVAAHAVLEHAGASLATLLSARAGQGAGNALLAAKLGIEAIKESRPLQFVATAPPSLREVRNALLTDRRGKGRPADGP